MNIFGYILIIIMILGTAFIGIKQPKMHSRIMIYDSQYTIVDENCKSAVEKIENSVEKPLTQKDAGKKTQQIVYEVQSTPTVKQNVQKTQQSVTPKVVQTTTNKAPKTVEVKTQTPVKVTTAPLKTTTTQTSDAQNVVQTIPSQTTQTVKVLSAKEEEIAWNVWRSNLQNRIMKDSKLPTVPIGTVFKVSFDVDKFGKVSNVQTWSTDQRYTPYAIEFIAPVIRSYQGKSILDFPSGSQRTKTTFTGGWKISNTSKYSNPNDYNDLERVVR